MLKNMKITPKLLCSFFLIAVLSSLSGIIGLMLLINMNSSYSSAMIDYGFSQGDIGLFNTEFSNSRSIIRDIIFNGDSQKQQSFYNDLKISNEKIKTDYQAMKKSMLTESDRKQYASIQTYMDAYNKVVDQVIKLALEGSSNEAYALMAKDATPLCLKIKSTTDNLMSQKITSGQALAKQLTQSTQTVTGAVVGFIVLSLLIAGLISIRIANSIGKPVKKMADAAQKAAQGDLSTELNWDTTDEIGLLARSFSDTIGSIRTYITDIRLLLSEMEKGDLDLSTKLDYKGDFVELKNSIYGIVESLNTALSEIKQTADQVLSGAGEVSDGAQALAQGTAEQSSSIEELTSSIEEISENVKGNAAYSTEANDKVTRVSTELVNSKNKMQNMISAMNRISVASEQIENINRTIEDIAFQTNILALNAAVEAARAGTAGKGFAVVADEVRNLASKSAEAAKNTTGLIQNSISEVASGKLIAEEAMRSIIQVVEDAHNASQMMARISEATNDQATTLNQITQSVEQIAAVVQNNSATAEESASASEELNSQAELLKELVGHFSLRKSMN